MMNSDGKMAHGSSKTVIRYPDPTRPRVLLIGDSNCNLINSACLPAMPFSAVVP